MQESPVIKFESREQAFEYLKYWQKVLMLESWIINVILIEESDIEENLAGNCEYVFESKSAVIRIVKLSDKTRKGSTVLDCDEETLVHELLHLKYDLFGSDNPTYEQTYLDEHEHQKLEELARTLIMVKYNVPFEWFKNPEVFK